MNRLMTSDEVAMLLQVDVVTIRRLIKKGELAGYRVGAEYRFQQSDIEDYLQQQRISTGESVGKNEKIFLNMFMKQIRTLMQLPSEKEQSQNLQITKQGYHVLELAKQEALHLHHSYISTEHLFVGLLSESEGMAAKILQFMELTQDQARSKLEEIVGKGDETEEHRIDFTPQLEEALALSMREAKKQQKSYFGTEHMLLGLLRQGDGIGIGILEEISRLNIKQLRENILISIDKYYKNEPYLEVPLLLTEIIPPLT